MSTIVGIDVGGTFTDLFVLDEDSSNCSVVKVASTPDDQSKGVLDGIGAFEHELSGAFGVVHGTTVATNALLERSGARTGLITTRGFKDVLEMRRRDRPHTWGLWGSYRPVIERDMRLEVDERVLADGTVLEPVDLAQVESAARALLARGAEGICIFFINSYANAENERCALARLQQIWPNQHITASSQILPELREFERCSTAALNAYLQPIVGRYLERLQVALSDPGKSRELLIVQSNGGVMTAQTACELPVRTALSGPAAGVIAAQRIGEAAGFDNIITCDMGGTSFDVSLITNGTHSKSAQTAVDFGLVIRTPMLEITTIGAGGGSIARVDSAGLLQVGPESAGSNPGPACYGFGNSMPTVTDANLLLGRINPDAPIGGGLLKLDRAAAHRAVEEAIAKPLGLEVLAAADAIVTVANARMADAIRLVSVERGHDPKHFSAMPFGGGGALHVGALIKEVGLAGALIPRYPGVNSALGCVLADMRHDSVQTLNLALDSVDERQLRETLRQMAERSRVIVANAGVRLVRIDVEFEFDMLYQGQSHTLSVPLGTLAPEVLTREQIRSAFETHYELAFGRILQGLAIRLVNARVAVIGRRPRFDLRVLAPREKNPLRESTTRLTPSLVRRQAARHTGLRSAKARYRGRDQRPRDLRAKRRHRVYRCRSERTSR